MQVQAATASLSKGLRLWVDSGLIFWRLINKKIVSTLSTIFWAASMIKNIKNENFLPSSSDWQSHLLSFGLSLKKTNDLKEQFWSIFWKHLFCKLLISKVVFGRAKEHIPTVATLLPPSAPLNKSTRIDEFVFDF